MNTTLTLTKASMKMFLRNKQAVFFTLVFPLILMFILGVIGFDKPPTFDIGLVTQTPDAATAQFVASIKAVPVFKVSVGTQAELAGKLEDGGLAAVIVVPDDFMSVGGRTEPRELTVLTNEGKQAEAATVVTVLNQYLDKTSLALAGAPAYFTLRTETVNARHLKYFDFLLPGLIAMSVMQMSVFSVAFVFVQYKEKGMLKRLLATPMQPVHFVGSNMATRLIVTLVQVAIFIAVGVLILDATVVGSYWLIALVALFGAFMFLGLGFTISGLASTVDSVPALANLFVFPMLFLSGVFFRLSSMPSWLQGFAEFLPLTHFAASLRAVMTEAASLGDIGYNLCIMLAWSAVFLATALVTFSFQERDSA
jgi:ABC-2 type transport system permease protein